MTILITGGAGFIGSYVNKLLVNEGYQCVVLDDLSRGDPRSVWKSPLIEGDIADHALIKKIAAEYNIKAVMHFAGSIFVQESVVSPAKYYANNFTKTLELIKALNEANVKKIVFSSSAAVYGLPRSSKLDENHPLMPISPYGFSKLFCEQMLRDFDRAYGFKHVILRYFNAAGGDPEHVQKHYIRTHSNLIPKVICTILEKKPTISVFGLDWPTKDGSPVRDYVHIHDIATAHILALKALLLENTSKTYNLGNDNGYSVLEVLEAIESVTKKKLQIDLSFRRDGDPPVLVADSEKARKELGWKPEILEIHKMVEDAWVAMNV